MSSLTWLQQPLGKNFLLLNKQEVLIQLQISNTGSATFNIGNKSFIVYCNEFLDPRLIVSENKNQLISLINTYWSNEGVIKFNNGYEFVCIYLFKENLKEINIYNNNNLVLSYRVTQFETVTNHWLDFSTYMEDADSLLQLAALAKIIIHTL
ncbi:MAG: hypothetical protein ACOVNR_06475 [Chitinophagaceae bacterium]